jgi:hypothetical protein
MESINGLPVPKYAVALVAAGGAIWILEAVVLGALHLSCFTCGSQFGTSGTGGLVGYPAQAAHDLAWADLYFAMSFGVVGLLVIIISLKAFRRGEKWAWYAILVFVVAGVLNTALDYLELGILASYLVFGVPALLGLVLSFKNVFLSKSGNTTQQSATDKRVG